MHVLEMADKITNAIDSKQFAMGVFIDLAKAFDTVDHCIPFNKLCHHGIRGVPLSSFKSYLTNRKQFVSYNSVKSSQQEVLCGVPQGLIPRPLLFLVYINDIINCSKVLHFILFADDTNIFATDKSLDNMINTVNFELKKLATWFRANKLSLNIKKSNFIIFQGRGHHKFDSKIALLLYDTPILPYLSYCSIA